METTMTAVETKRFSAIMSSIKMAESMMAKIAREAKKDTPAELLAKAYELDAAGDRYKAEGKLETAKFCYSRALKLAIKSGL